MTSQPKEQPKEPQEQPRESLPSASRRAVLGTALGGAALAAPPGNAHAQDPAPSPFAAGRPRPRPWKLRDRMAGNGAWADFLRGQDLRWSRLPTRWYEGPFLGDRLLGSMIYQDPATGAIRFTVQHGQVRDHRPEFGSGWGTCRLPVGHLTLEPVGTITAVDWRLSL